jgi:hypothetical protein
MYAAAAAAAAACRQAVAGPPSHVGAIPPPLLSGPPVRSVPVTSSKSGRSESEVAVGIDKCSGSFDVGRGSPHPPASVMDTAGLTASGT